MSPWWDSDGRRCAECTPRLVRRAAGAFALWGAALAATATPTAGCYGGPQLLASVSVEVEGCPAVLFVDGSAVARSLSPDGEVLSVAVEPGPRRFAVEAVACEDERWEMVLVPGESYHLFLRLWPKLSDDPSLWHEEEMEEPTDPLRRRGGP